MNFFSFIIGVVLTAAAMMAVEAKKLLISIIMMSLVSLLSVVSFVIMKAPDVAITEAAVGAGLTTAIFLLTLRRLRKEES